MQTEFEYVPDESQLPSRGRKRKLSPKPKGDAVRSKALYGLAHVYAQLYKSATGYDYPSRDLKVILKSLHSYPDSYTIEDLKSSMTAFMDRASSWHAQQDPPLLEVHFWQRNMTKFLPSKRPRNKSTLDSIGQAPGNEPPLPPSVEDHYDELEQARQNWIRKEKAT